MKKTAWMAGGGLICLAAGLGIWKLAGREGAGGGYRTGRVERGELVQTVRATGTIQPRRLVQVGTQVNGPVQKLYVDFNDTVKAGDLVAQIDPIVYEARLAQDRANLAQSQASVEQTKARLAQAESEWTRTESLARRDMLSKADLETAQANRDVLLAQLKVSEAAVAQAEASLRLSQANLGYTTIRSPVDGVVLARNVSEGQTVVASMSAQVLFLIATDLGEVQVEASIPEADIGRIRPEQPVTFTVDAYDRTFRGVVEQVRLSASTVQNVVTYPVVVRANNPERRLFPGMTANINCEVARREDALKVPNAALRFKPDNLPPDPAKAVESVAGQAQSNRVDRAGSDRRSGPGEAGDGPAKLSVTHEPAGSGRRGGRPGEGRRNRSRVWVEDGRGEPLRAVTVVLGINDGAFTELVDAGGLEEGQEVITGKALAGEDAKGVVNPFMPQMPGRNPRRAAR